VAFTVGAEAYVGLPVLDNEGTPVSILVALYKTELTFKVLRAQLDAEFVRQDMDIAIGKILVVDDLTINRSVLKVSLTKMGNGLEASVAIRQLEMQASILPHAMIGVSVHANRKECIHAGMDEHMAKPVRSDELLLTIEYLMQAANNQEIA
tara:strand:+ start:4056 stop:4508 length:453 start_codon:yes stop_codon:yes gene_type:complete